MKANTNNENTSELNRHQRRMFEAATRKNQQFSPHKSLPYGRITSKGFGFVKVEAMKTSEVGK